MTNVLIIGATGSLGQALREELAGDDSYTVRLFSRSADRLALAANEKAVSGSVYDAATLRSAMDRQDIVFVAFSGDLPTMAENIIIEAMQDTGVSRVVFTSSMGIYGEVVGEPRGVVPAILRPYRHAADVIENSGLDYTVLRPGWFDNGSDSTCRITRKGEAFEGHDVSRKAIVTVVKSIIDDPRRYIGESLGLYR